MKGTITAREWIWPSRLRQMVLLWLVEPGQRERAMLPRGAPLPEPSSR